MTTLRSIAASSWRVLCATLLLPQLTPAAALSAQAPVIQKTVQVGKGVYEVVSNDPDGTIYVASTGADSRKIYLLDGKTLETRSSIDVSEAPAYGLGINPVTQTLYTSNTRSGSVSAIDLKSGAVIATIKDTLEPRAGVFRVLVDEINNRIYVSVTGGRIWVIDGKSNRLAGIVENVGRSPIGLALDSTRRVLYAANQGDNEVVAIDLATRRITARYPTGAERSTMLAIDPGGKRLFVTNQGSGDLSVLNLADGGKVVETIKTGAGALGVVYNPATDLIYVANRGTSTVTVINGANYQIKAQLSAPGFPNTLALDSRSNTVYLTSKLKATGGDDAAGDTVSRIGIP